MRSSICATVIPADSTATRCRRSTTRGAKRAPTVAPIANATTNNTPASDRAENTVTTKSYKSGEHQPSSERPKSDMSHATRQVFDGCSCGVCPVAADARLPGTLAGHRRRARGSGLRIEIATADDQRPQIGIQVVAKRNASRNVQVGDFLVGDPVQ